MKHAPAHPRLLNRHCCPHCHEQAPVFHQTSIDEIGRWPKFSAPHYRLQRLDLPAPTPLSIRWCARCDLGFADPLLDGELTARLYNDVIEKEQSRRAYESSVGWRTQQIHLLLDLLDQFLPPRPDRRLLDFGAGWGLLLREARQRGWGASGIELADEERAALVADGFQVFSRMGEAPAESFDAVGSTQVLEHVADFQEIVRAQAAKLRPGGLLYIDVPNASTWARRQTGLFANPLEHVNYFTHQFLSRRLLDPKDFLLVWPRLNGSPRQAWRAFRQGLGHTPLTLLFQKRAGASRARL